MEETWKDILGYEGMYQVSNLGRVRSLDRDIWNGVNYFKKQGRILKQGENHKGYPIVYLSVSQVDKTCSVHRLVAQAFIPNPDNKPQVNHINGNKKDNTVDNLEWCTALENNRHALRNGLVSHDNMHKALRKKVRKIDVNTGEILEEYDSVTEAAKSVSKGRTGCISRVCNKKRKTSYGFKWEYIEKEGNAV